MKIITVTLNPCIDADYVTDKPFSAGELNRVGKPKLSYNGKGINVSRELLRLGEYSTAVTILSGESGERMEKSLRDEGIGVSCVHIAGELRRNTAILDSLGTQTQINESGSDVPDEAFRELVGLFKSELVTAEKTVVILSGSLPPSLAPDTYRRLGAIAKNSGAYVIVDCDGEALKEALEAFPDLIKPNREEFEALTGKKLTGEGEGLRIDAVREALRFCRDNNVAVLCTLGEDGSVFAGPEGSYMCQAVKANIKTFKAAGDTFLASFVYWHMVKERDCDSALALASHATASFLEGRQ